MKKVNFICRIDGCAGQAHARQLCPMHYERQRLAGSTSPPGRRKSRHGVPALFLKTIAIPFVGDVCLLWPYARSDTGYASIRSGGKTSHAHRLVCEAVHGEAPEGKPMALHSCGNGHLSCVNPNHLSWGDAVENSDDMVKHGRAWWCK